MWKVLATKEILKKFFKNFSHYSLQTKKNEAFSALAPKEKRK
jgi:hypothetical protein